MKDSCSWCIMGECRLGKDEENCSWKGVKYSKDGIISKMDEERKHIMELSTEVKKTKDWDLIKEKLKIITDIVQGLETMSAVLEHEFGYYKKIEDFIFAGTLSSALLHAKKIEMKQKRKAK